MFKVNNRNTRTRCEICSKLTIKTPERFESIQIDLNRLWKNFNLAFIGYKAHCTVLKYHNAEIQNAITEYMFPTLNFNIENFHSPEFQKYTSDY